MPPTTKRPEDDGVIMGGRSEKPDPTVLTTQQLERALIGLREILEARLDGNDRATGLIQKATDKLPEYIAEQIKQLERLHDEKFASVQKQFQERDVRTEQSGKDAKTAVDAALQAAKEAVGKSQEASDRAVAKSETATVKQIDQIGVLFQTMTGAVGDKIDDLKTRVLTVESRNAGSLPVALAIAAIAVAVLSAGFSVAMMFVKH